MVYHANPQLGMPCLPLITAPQARSKQPPSPLSLHTCLPQVAAPEAVPGGACREGPGRRLTSGPKRWQHDCQRIHLHVPRVGTEGNLLHSLPRCCAWMCRDSLLASQWCQPASQHVASNPSTKAPCRVARCDWEKAGGCTASSRCAACSCSVQQHGRAAGMEQLISHHTLRAGQRRSARSQVPCR